MTDRFFGSKIETYMNYGMVTIPGTTTLHEPQTTSTINYNVQFGYYANWDYNKFINRGGNGYFDI